MPYRRSAAPTARKMLGRIGSVTSENAVATKPTAPPVASVAKVAPPPGAPRRAPCPPGLWRGRHPRRRVNQLSMC